MQQAKMMIDEVKTVRDELKLKAHLFKMDVKDQWVHLEKQYEDVIARVDKAKTTTGDIKDDVWLANKFAFNKIKDGYNQIKEDLS